jgi:hypothetical protein
MQCGWCHAHRCHPTMIICLLVGVAVLMTGVDPVATLVTSGSCTGGSVGMGSGTHALQLKGRAARTETS